MKKLSILLLICFAACQQKEPEQINNLAYPPKPTPTPKQVYKNPEIGMDFSDFERLCLGERLKEDRSNTLKTADKLVTTFTLRYTDKRNDKDCVGTFTFYDKTLHSIFVN